MALRSRRRRRSYEREAFGEDASYYRSVLNALVQEYGAWERPQYAVLCEAVAGLLTRVRQLQRRMGKASEKEALRLASQLSRMSSALVNAVKQLQRHTESLQLSVMEVQVEREQVAQALRSAMDCIPDPALREQAWSIFEAAYRVLADSGGEAADSATGAAAGEGAYPVRGKAPMVPPPGV
jgi:hypothetical protein